MGALSSLSKSATVICSYLFVFATVGFGTLFLLSWIAEEFAKSEKWKKRRTWLLIFAIIGCAGEQFFTVAEFKASQHLPGACRVPTSAVQVHARRALHRRCCRARSTNAGRSTSFLTHSAMAAASDCICTTIGRTRLICPSCFASARMRKVPMTSIPSSLAVRLARISSISSCALHSSLSITAHFRELS